MSGKLQWSLTNANVGTGGASVTKAAVPGTIHVCTGIICMNSYYTGYSIGIWELLDGATVLLQGYGFASNTQPGAPTIITDIELPGSIGNSMTLEFASWSGGAPNNSVNLLGYDL